MATERRAYIIRIWRTKDGHLVGHVTDPEGGWRHPFRNATDLWEMIAGDSFLPHEQPETKPEVKPRHDE